MEQPNVTRALVKQILLRAEQYPWTVATGRLMLMLEPELCCINVFHDRLEQPYTRIHSHTLDFHSQIIAGEMRQRRYARFPAGFPGAVEHGFQDQTLDQRPISSGTCFLLEGAEELYRSGDAYEITAPEIHQANALGGTVTLVTRQFKTAPSGVSAFWGLPRDASPPEFAYGAPATADLIGEVIGLALRRF